MSEPKFEAVLYLMEDFLTEEKKRRARGLTPEALFAAIEGLQSSMMELRRNDNLIKSALDTVVADQIEVKMRLDRYGRRLRDVEKLARGKGNGPDSGEGEEDTGVFRIEEAKRAAELVQLKGRIEQQEKEIQQTRERRDSDITWWSRQRWIWFVMIALAVFTALCSGCVGVVVWKITSEKAERVPEIHVEGSGHE